MSAPLVHAVYKTRNGEVDSACGTDDSFYVWDDDIMKVTCNDCLRIYHKQLGGYP